jgi:glycosyltransferase involved in cell wall biosynthesis
MSDHPLVSVIIIFLNGEKFIEEAIESIFTQTYNNWEILLVDDGSTDSSTDIALKYAEKYPEKVRYLEHENHCNRGMSTSRNLGIENAKGDYIAFLDADDVWFPHKLEQQVQILNSHPEAAMVYGSSHWWHSWSGNPEDAKLDRCDYVEKQVPHPNTVIMPPRLVAVFVRGTGVPAPSTVLARRESLKNIGGFEDIFRGLYEDQAFYAKICLDSPVFVASECWIKYRQHKESACQVALDTGGEYQARLFFLNWLENYLSQQKVQDTEVWQAVKKALWRYRHPILYRLRLMVRQLFPAYLRSWVRGNLLVGRG